MKLKSLFFALLFFTMGSTIAKENNLPIPVTVNETITVTLFFPSEIKKVIEPAVNYKFEYEDHGTMGTLMARKGATSNLTVITEDGSIFSFLLQYDQEVTNFTYLLSTDQAIGVINPSGTTSATSTVRDSDIVPSPQNEALKTPGNITTTVKEQNGKPQESQVISKNNDAFAQNQVAESSLYDKDRDSYYEIFCENNYNRKFDASKSVKAGTGIELKLNALTADKNEFYFVLQVTNRLTSQFGAEKLRFFVRTSLGDEPVKMTPLHVFNHQEIIEAGRTKKMVYVFEEFRLSENQKVYVKLDEIDGIRSTVLDIKSEMINAVGRNSFLQDDNL